MLRAMFGLDQFARLESYMGDINRSIKVAVALALIASFLVSSVPYLGGQLLNRLLDYSTPFTLSNAVNLCSIISLLIILWYTTLAHSSRELHMISLATTKRMRNAMNEKMMRIGISRIDQASPGSFSARFTIDMPNVGNLISSDYSTFISNNVLIVIVLVLMILISPMLSLVYLICLPVALLISRKLVIISKRDMEEQRHMTDELNAEMSDLITNHRAVKTNNLEDVMVSRFKDVNRNYSDAFLRTAKRSSLIQPITNITSNLGYVAVVIFGAIFILDGSLGIGMFVAFMVYVRLINKPLLMVSDSYERIQSELISLDRILDILEMPEEDDPGTEDWKDPQGRIEFEDVSFSYIEGKEVLHSVSFEAKSGRILVILGPTGSGKTTITNLLMRFYSPNSGRILLDGQDLAGLSRKSLVENMALVIQDPSLFDGTIHENIAYNRDVSRSAVEEAARITGIYDYVSALPQGFDTMVRNDVVSIPLAQRRMIAMARALIGDPKVLILDEAMSGLDPITGANVLEGLKRIMQDRTVIIVSHSQELAVEADDFIHVSDGRIADLGRMDLSDDHVHKMLDQM
jgi:ATP-binding cassette subfamily B protein